MKNVKKIAVLYSGGLDSRIMYELAKGSYPEAEVTALYYKHGVHGEAAEIASLPDFVEVRQVDWLDAKHKTLPKKNNLSGAIYIPGRNLVFAVLAASQEVADEVWLGGLWDEDYPDSTDKNTAFKNMTSEVLTYVLSPFIDSVKVRTPFVELGWSKQHAVAWALDNGITADEITKTVSCYDANDGTACGNCMQCVKRDLVFRETNLSEPYRENPRVSSHMLNLIKHQVPVLLARKAEDLSRDNLNFWYLWLEHYHTMTEQEQMATFELDTFEIAATMTYINDLLDRPLVPGIKVKDTL